MLATFSLKLFFILPCVGKLFEFMEFTFLGNALIRGISTNAPPHSKLASEFLLSRPRQRKITHSHRHHSFGNLFLLTAEKSRENHDLLGKIQLENMKMTRNIRFFIFCMIFNFFKCDNFIVL